MLIYANQLRVIGGSALDDILRSIAGWLKKITERHFSTEELISGEEFDLGKRKVRTYVADQHNPKLYSILFSNPDRDVKGRQWITEMGIRVEEEQVVFSVLLETSDISTQVRDFPTSSKPNVIKYIQKNCNLAPETAGLHAIHLHYSQDDLRAFRYEIDREERKYPLVLLSQKFDGGTLSSVDELQGHLLGLAQVIICDQDMDSWMMEKELSKRYSAWGGAINIIYPRYNREYCNRRLFLLPELEEMLLNSTNIDLEILSVVTHLSNGYRKRLHFSPHDVRAKRQRDYVIALREKISNKSNETDNMMLLEEAMDEISRNEQIISDINEQHKKSLETADMRSLELEDQIEFYQDRIRKLEYNTKILSANIANQNESKKILTIDAELVFSVISHSPPTPTQCLKLIEEMFPSRFVILDSAYKSAQKSQKFKYGQRLTDMFYRLGTSFYDGLSEVGEGQTRKSFTENEYAATESEYVQNNEELSSKRTFEYRGERVQMFRHLKIGISDNSELTIRVHFYWDSSNKKIVIGYCGPHLPIKSH